MTTSAIASTPVPPADVMLPLPKTTFKLPRYAAIMSLEPYLAQARLVAMYNQWSPRDTAANVALALEGNMLQVLLALTPTKQQDYQTLATV